ncbi:MAG: GspH/FimT family protein [Burkholderiaceae bacterium]
MSLIESMIVVVMVAILLTTAIPRFARFLSAHRASAAINDLMHGFAVARNEALRRGRRVYIAPFDGHWHDGWSVFVDRNDNRVADVGDEVIVVHAALPPSITITSTSGSAREPFTDLGRPQRPYVMFDGGGYPRQRSGAFNAGGIVVTDRTGDATTIRSICLGSYGRARIVDDRSSC